MRKSKQIAFIHPDLGIGGAERLILDIASALTQKKHEVSFLTNHFDKNHAFEELKNDEDSITVYGDWIPRSIFGKCQALCAYIRMVYLVLVHILLLKKEDRPDMYFVDLIPIAIPFLKLANLKVVYYCHHPDLLASSHNGILRKVYRKPIDWLEGKATETADIILVNSEYTASVFRKTFPHISKKIQILYPTIATSYQEMIGKLGSPKKIQMLIPEIPDDGAFIFLSINRFHPAKTLEYAIHAMGHLKSKMNSHEWNMIFLIMAGGYDPQSSINALYYSKLVKLANDLELANKVIFIKSPSDQFKSELLSSCNCLIYTPVNEHFGIVPLEAMAVAKPVIACNSGGPCETIDDGNTGYLCEPTPQSMADFMLKIVKLPDLEKMGQKGKIRLEEKFSFKHFSKFLDKVVNDKTLENV